MGDSPTSAIGTPDQIREHLRALQAAGVDQVLLMHQAGQLDHDANCRSLELFATEVMPEFVEGEAEREAAKAERLGAGHRGRAGPQGAPADAGRHPRRGDRTAASATSRRPMTTPSRGRPLTPPARSGSAEASMSGRSRPAGSTPV